MYSVVETQHTSLAEDRKIRKSASSFRVLKETFIMSVHNIKRYKANLISGLIEFAVLMVVFAIFSGALEFRNGYEAMTQNDIYIFFLASLSLIAFNSTAIWAPLNRVQNDLYNGTLEYLYFNPSSRYAYFVGYLLADAFFKFFIIFLPAFFVLVIFSGMANITLVYALTISLVVLINLMSLGILIALSAILWKQVSAIASIINLLLQFMAGMIFPVTTFPEPLRYVSYIFPQTFGFDLMRYFSFHGNWQTLLPVEMELLILGFFTLLYLTLSIILLKKTEKHAKKNGLHLI